MRAKTILVTGLNLDLQYNRNLVILNGLKKLGFKIETFSFSKFNRPAAEKIREISKTAYFTFIPSFGHKSVSFVKKNSHCDLVFDPLISKYMTNIHDYRSHHSFSYEALRSWYRDKVSTSKADFVIFDTSTHREYFLKKYKLPKEKTGVVYVGANNTDFDGKKFPKLPNSGKFRVGFVGHFIPLQGVLKILKAASLMKDETDIEFYFIGEGYQFEKAKKYARDHQLDQVIFEGQVDYEQLDSYINSFDLCMGIFGDTLKANVVIPNKIFNYASCGRPVLTMDSNAIKEVFTHNRDIFLCKPKAEEMVRSIKSLKENMNLRTTLGKNIYNLVSQNYDEKKTAASLVSQYENFKSSQA